MSRLPHGPGGAGPGGGDGAEGREDGTGSPPQHPHPQAWPHTQSGQTEVPPTLPAMALPIPTQSSLSETEIQQMLGIHEQYQMQSNVLSQQFEEQQRLLRQEQQLKMQDYMKVLMIRKQEEEYYEHQQKLQQQIDQERVKSQRLELLRNKEEGSRSAIASNEVKAKLRECLLKKDVNSMKPSPPDFRQWATQHSSLEKHSPPTSGMSPPLRAHLLGKYDDDYPLRKAVSEPNLKMRSKMSLRQKVMQRNSPITHRRELITKKRGPLSTSEPNLKVRLALKQKMLERRGSPLLRRKERHVVAHLQNHTPMSIDTAGLCDSNPDSGPNTPPSSQGSQGSADTTPQKEEAAVLPLQMMSKMVNSSMPNISIGQPRDKLKPNATVTDAMNASISACGSEAELRARLTAQYGAPLTSHHMSNYHNLPGVEGEMVPGSPYIEAQLKAMELNQSAGFSAMPAGASAASAVAVAAAAAATAANIPGGVAMTHGSPTGSLQRRPPLNRTHSAPLPLPGQLLWAHQQLVMQQQQKHQENIMKETAKHHLKQRLLQRSGSKNHMANVDEEVEARLAQEMKDVRERDDRDVVIIEDHGRTDIQRVKDRNSFHQKLHSNSLGGASSPEPKLPLRKPLERAQSSPMVAVPPATANSMVTEIMPTSTYSTGFVYDTLMLKHRCLCSNDSLHPESPGRLQSIYSRLQESGLLARCQRLKARKATLDELQTCHSEAHTLLYGSSSDQLDPQVLETMLPMPKFQLPCGGVGVDSDTVWHDTHTPTAARVAAGCAVELAFSVATGEQQNGFAIVRPPGHHAEPTQPMGFCYFNSIAVATKLLLNILHMKKILIVDWDVHHGNSTQQIFYADPRVLYISLHRHDDGFFFPGTGASEECGIDKGRGYNVNIAFSGSLNPPMRDAEYMTAFRTVVMPIGREFQPEIILVSAGFDAAEGHPPPLGGYMLSSACFGHMTQQLMTLAKGKVCLVLEGGYELTSICDASEMCLRALLGDEIPSLPKEEMCRTPNHHAVKALETTFKYQTPYWGCLSRSSGWLQCSWLEAQQLEREEADTVSAFASLSVVPEKLGVVHSSEPMEES